MPPLSSLNSVVWFCRLITIEYRLVSVAFQKISCVGFGKLKGEQRDLVREERLEEIVNTAPPFLYFNRR